MRDVIIPVTAWKGLSYSLAVTSQREVWDAPTRS